MPRVVTPEHLWNAGLVRKHLAKYQEIELLLQLGEYKAGGDPEADEAVRRIAGIRALLRQNSNELTQFSDVMPSLRGALE